MTQSHWSDWWQDRLREVLPGDLEQRPIYMARQHEIPAALHTTGARAWTSRLLDYHLRSMLEQEGRWQGPGLALVVVDDSILFGDVERGFATILHEIGHGLEFESKCVTRWQVNFAPELGPVIAEQSGIPSTVESLFPGRVFPLWQDHGADWIRASLHIHHRAFHRGWWIAPSMMSIGGEYRGLSDGMEYRQRLLPELTREHDTPIVEILKRPAPDGFNDLWIKDTQALSTVRVERSGFNELKG